MSGTRVYPEWEFGDVLKSGEKWDGTERKEARMMFIGPRDGALTHGFWGLILVAGPLTLASGEVFYRGQRFFWELDPDWR